MIHRGIVIVHGVGESGKGNYIDSFVEPLADFLCGAVGSENVDLEVRNNSAEAETWATLRLQNSSGEEEEWHVREAWWARSFKPSGAQTVLFWGIVAGLTVVWTTLKTVFMRNLLRSLPFVSYHTMPLARDDLGGRPLDPATQRLADPEDQGLWMIPKPGRGKALIDAIIWLGITLGYSVLAILGLIVIVPLYVFLLLPLSLVAPHAVATVQRKIIGILVRSVGDQQAMTTRRFALAAASNEVSRALWLMVAPEGIASHARRDPAFTGFNTVTVVAHSGGAIVSFDALVTQVEQWMGEPLRQGLVRPQRLNWITAGSGLNLAYRMRKKKNAHESASWNRPIGYFVNWLNIYARYDPIPQGPPPEGLVETLVGADPWLANPPDTTSSRPPFACVRVVNSDFPGSDHFGYWRNDAEVMSRVVAMVTHDAIAARPLDPQSNAFPSTHVGEIGESIEEAVRSGGAHRVAVLRGQVPVYLAGLLFLVLLLWAPEVGRWVLGRESFLGVEPLGWRGHQLDGAFPNELLGASIRPIRELLVGSVVIAFVGLVIAQVLQLFVDLARWVKQGGSAALVFVPGFFVLAACALAIGGYALYN